jgi:subfamily B ATP-binding cassette protein MsbA
MSASPQHDVTNLVELEESREQLRKKLRIWHLLIPTSGDDLRAYRSLLKFVRPYRGKLILSVILAMSSALFVGAELGLLKGALEKILSGPTRGDVAASRVENSGANAPTGAANPAVAPAPNGAAPATAPNAPATEEKGGAKEEKDAGDHTLLRRVKNWWDGKRIALENWFYDKCGLPKPTREEQTTHRATALVIPADEKARRQALLWALCALLTIFIVLASIAKYGQSVIVTGASRRVVRDIRTAVFSHLMGLSVRFHQKNHSAQLVSRITGDLEVFGRFLTEALIRFIQDSFEFLTMLGFVALNQGTFIFIIAGVIAVAIAPVNHISKKLRHNDKKSQQGMAEVATVLQEVLTGQRVVKAFASEGREMVRFRRVTRDHMKTQMKTRKLRSMTEPIVMGIGGLGVSAVIIAGGYKVLDGTGGFTATDLIMNVMALARAMTSLRSMGKQLNDFQLGLAAADRVGTVFEARSEVKEKAGAAPLPPFQREIRFEGVHFRHDPDKPTLQGIDLAIRKGEKVALVGPSGAGKTTIIDLVPRFYDVEGGRISIDGHDLRDVTLKSLREQIGIVSQETVLFRDSIRDNIAYGRPDATDAEVVAAAKAANAHDFISKKPGGYGWRVGERGHTLSGGERQRLAIARALLLDPPILILDEATSALDSESEAVVQAALQRLMAGRTVIVIAHRLSTVRDATRIVVLEKGRVAEIGSHEELMRRTGGLYRRHYEIQTRASDEPPHGRTATEAAAG